MKNYKIGFFGDGPWAQNALKLFDNYPFISIEFIVLRYDQPDFKLKEMAFERDISVYKVKNVNDKEFVSKLENKELDLNISMSFDQIIKKELIQLARHTFINCHAGALPFYRGRNVLNWVLINDEKEFGITTHFIDEGIDTGNIISQKKFIINDTDTYATLLKKAELECAKLIVDSTINVLMGDYNEIAQTSIHPIGFYCTRRQLGDEIINWKSSSREIFNFVRALVSPGPIARTYHKGVELGVYDCEVVKEAPHYIDIPGSIIGKSEEGFYIKTGDSFILVKDIREMHTQIKYELSIGMRLDEKKD